VSKEINTLEADLRRLYHEEKLLQREIAEIYGCSQATICRRMQRHGIQARSKAEALVMARGYGHLRRDFNGDLKEKAYLIGFCRGDLYVVKRCEGSLTITISCTTTRQTQTDLLVALFSPYGYVCVGEPGRQGRTHFRTYLNLSFDFLLHLPDAIPDFALADTEAFFAFVAGYTDAEGNVGVYCGRADFSLRSYDKVILHQIHATLAKIGIQFPKPRITSPKGHIDAGGYALRQDYWCLQTSRKDSLLELFARIGPYLRHADRIQSMKAALQNIEERK